MKTTDMNTTAAETPQAEVWLGGEPTISPQDSPEESAPAHPAKEATPADEAPLNEEWLGGMRFTASPDSPEHAAPKNPLQEGEKEETKPAAPEVEDEDLALPLLDLGADPVDVIAPEEEPLREEAIFGDVVGYGFSDDEMERYFRSPKWQLGRQQHEAPLLHSEQKAEREAFWKQILTGDVRTIPQHIRKKLMGDAEQLTQEEEDYQIIAAINRSWAADHLGVKRKEVKRAWPIYRERLARRLDVADTDEDVFLALSVRESEKALRKAGEGAYELAYKVGIEGRREYDLTPFLKDLDAYRADNVRGLATKAFEDGSAKRRKYMPLACKVWSGMKSITAMEDGLDGVEDTWYGVPDLLEAVRELGQLTRQERNEVLHITRSILPRRRLANESDKNMFEVILKAMRRGGSKTPLMCAQAVVQTGAAYMRLLGRSGGKFGEKVNASAEQLDKYSIVFDDLRRMAQNELDPLLPPQNTGLAGQVLVDISHALPDAILSFIKHPIIASLRTVRDSTENTLDLRQRAPEADADLALTAGALGLLAQRHVESLLSQVGGNKLGQAISRAMRQRGAPFSQYIFHGGRVSNAMAFEILREFVADKAGQAANYMTQDTVLKCYGASANIDWKQFGNSIFDVNMNMRAALAELPFILIGAGHVALRDFNSPEALLQNNCDALIPWGVPEAVRIKIASEPDIDRQGWMLREALVGSTRWGGADFLLRAARALGLLNYDYFTAFKDRSFLCDFLKLPSMDAQRAKIGEIEQAGGPPPDPHTHGIFRLQQHMDAEYRNQLVELWRDTWKKAHYSDGATHLPKPDWEVFNVQNPSQRRLALYLDEILKSPKYPVPRRIRREGLYAPYAEVERKALIRDRVEEVKSISHLMALHSLSTDSMAVSRVPIVEMKRHADDARQRYLGHVIGAVLRIKRGDDQEAVLAEVEKAVLQDIEKNLKSLPEVPLWLLQTSSLGESSLPSYEMKGVPSWSKWINHPDLVDVYRVCVGTRANVRMLAELLPLSNDYYTSLSVGMTPLQACNHLLLRELPCDKDKIPNYPHEELAENVTAQQFSAFCAENKRIFNLTEQMFGDRLVKDTGEYGIEFWAARLPDGTQSPWHRSKQHAINDYVTHAQTYLQQFNMWYFYPEKFGREHNIRNSGKTQDWLDRLNPIVGHDQIMSYASRDMLKLMDERAAFLQPGMFVNRSFSHFCPVQHEKDDGVTPLFSAADATTGRYEVNHFTLVSPVSYLQSRTRVFWERMLKSKRVDSKELERFLTRVEQDFPLMKEAMEKYFPDPNTLAHVRWSRNRTSALANKMSVYTTCYLLSNPKELEMPDSVRLWLQLTPLAPSVVDEKPTHEYQRHARRTVARGVYDRTLMMWVNRKSSEKLRRLAPMMESLRGKPFFRENQDEQMRQLFDMSLGKDPVMQMEQGWMQLLCGEEVLRSSPQRWLNFLHDPQAGWSGLGNYEKRLLAAFMNPVLHPEQKAAADDADDDLEQQDESDVVRLRTAVFEMARILRQHPHLRQYGYLDSTEPHASMLLIDRKMPVMERLEEPNYTGLPLHPGSHVLPPTVVPYGKFQMDENAPQEVGKALALMSRLRMFPATRPIFKGGKISWKGVEYGGLKGKTPRRVNDWEIIDNPLEPLLQMRDRMETVEDMQMDDEVANVDLLYNSILPADHDEVYGNVTVYKNPAKVNDMCRLMPGEFYAHHPNVSNPYVVQCTRGAYIFQRQMADTPELMAQAMQPLENFRPWGDQNRNEESMNRGRMAAIRQNLELIVQHPFEYDNEDSPINVSPREMLMRLAVDTGFLDTLKGAYPEQVDYGNALTYCLVNALYEYSCHPEVPESRSALKAITQRLSKSEGDYNLVLRVLREAARTQTKPSPAAAQFASLRDESPAEEEPPATMQADDDLWLPVVKLPRARDISQIEEEEDADFGPVDVDEAALPPLELMQFDFSAEHHSGTQGKLWAPKKIEDAPALPEASPEPQVAPPTATPEPPPIVHREDASQAPLMKAVETDDADVWGDLFKFKFPGMKAADTPAAPSSRKSRQGLFDFGDEES